MVISKFAFLVVTLFWVGGQCWSVCPVNTCSYRISSISVYNEVAMTSGEGSLGGKNLGKSFVSGPLRDAAMALHTRDQAPREGKAPAQRPVSNWKPGRGEYLLFLRDSFEVYEAFEDIINDTKDFEALRDTGLERTSALKKDFQWFKSQYNIQTPQCGQPGEAYATFLRNLAKEGEAEAGGESSASNWKPKFICHYYNHYFAHTAGGRMIGKKMGDMLLDSHTLEFYKWESCDVRKAMEAVKGTIDEMAEGWGEEEREECLRETKNTFKYAGGLLSYMRGPV